jgi:hypothetical protein
VRDRVGMGQDGNGSYLLRCLFGDCSLFLLTIEHSAIFLIKEPAMNEILFLVEDVPEGGFTAKALGESIFTEADNLEELHVNVRDAVRCHFDEGKSPKMIRLHFVHEEVIAV